MQIFLHSPIGPGYYLGFEWAQPQVKIIKPTRALKKLLGFGSNQARALSSPSFIYYGSRTEPVPALANTKYRKLEKFPIFLLRFPRLWQKTSQKMLRFLPRVNTTLPGAISEETTTLKVVTTAWMSLAYSRPEFRIKFLLEVR